MGSRLGRVMSGDNRFVSMREVEKGIGNLFACTVIKYSCHHFALY